MLYVLASDPLAAWGQIAASVLLLYLFILIVVGLALALALLLGLTWVRQKVELIKKLRPTVDSINTTTEAAIHGTLPPPSSQYADDTRDKIARSVAKVPVYARTAEQKIEHGSDQVASAVIEFRARTEMAKGILKAFFLPGLKPRQQTVLEEEGVGFRSPGYKMLVEEKVPADAAVGYASGSILASQLKDESVDVVTETPKELRDIPARDEHKDVAIH